MGIKYRKAVIGVFVNVRNEVLTLERSDFPGSWQLPQGGVEQDESHEEAILREMNEELGTSKIEIITSLESEIAYEFTDLKKCGITEKYDGQSLKWFLLKFSGVGQPDLERASDKEFIDFKWVDWKIACSEVTPWKREAYEKGFYGLGFK